MLDYTQAESPKDVFQIGEVVSVMEPIMSEKKKPVLFSQLEDALEERQDNDRRKNQKPVLPADVKQDRRKADRRAGK